MKIGLLPLYVKLYDDYWPEIRERADAFPLLIAEQFRRRNVEVITVSPCSVQAEFEAAVRHFEAANVDAIVTLHLAYSPSLESADLLASTSLPLVVLDTTPTFDYSPGQDPSELMYNHGIHGVQDLCNVLLRRGKDFQIEAGHWQESDVIDRVRDCAKASKMAKAMKQAKVGRLGRAFEGMGDFRVPGETLRTEIGVETLEFDFKSVPFIEDIDNSRIREEMQTDRTRFRADKLDEDVHRQTTEASLKVRDWIQQQGLTAFTMNFLDITKSTGLPCMPFLEACKAMERGIGYAGEGDVLTAALTGALLSVYPDASFAEMFCPDWKHNRIFLSHMGEMNLRVADEKPLLQEKPFPFTDAGPAAVACGRFRGGDAVYVCLSPGKNDRFSLIVSPIKMLEVVESDRMEETVRGWFKPPIPVADYLSAFSRQGGIHHGVIVYGNECETIARFGEIMGWRVVRIG
nr:hypothetical protein [Cohnella sp. GbtcB17]